MFLAGCVSVIAACGGYLQSGGGEELLRRALVKLETGKADFKSIDFRWKRGEMVVNELRHEPFNWPRENPQVRCNGLFAKTMTLKLDLFPWPPKIENITIDGMHDIDIVATNDFLQSGQLQQLRKTGNLPTITFRDCNLKMKFGDLNPILLTGCGGELRQSGDRGVILSEENLDDRRKELRGSFSLKELNGKSFNFRLETLDDGSWLFTGSDIQLDSGVLKAPKNPFEALMSPTGKVDPVYLLVASLFSGEMGAAGKISSLRVFIQPASGTRTFMCDGEVGYNDLKFQLPPPQEKSGQVLPGLLNELLGAGETFWPRWMQVDRIRTGDGGRVSFHMADRRLNFACDEGSGSAFTGMREGVKFPPLESLKGSVEADAEGRARRIILRGFLGDELSFETRIDRMPDQKRIYELLVEPRAGDRLKIVFGKPLWRFASRVQDYTSQPESDSPRVDFELEADARHFPWLSLLPAGLQELSGHMYAKGKFTRSNQLQFETLRIDDDARLAYGGVDEVRPDAGDFAALWPALHAFFGTTIPWKMQDLDLATGATVQFSNELQWETTELQKGTLQKGTLSHAGLSSDIGIAGIVFNATHKRQKVAPFASSIEARASAPSGWQVVLRGDWKRDAGQLSGTFNLKEENVPLALHPQREKLEPAYISADGRRVNRETEVTVTGSNVQRVVK